MRLTIEIELGSEAMRTLGHARMAIEEAFNVPLLHAVFTERKGAAAVGESGPIYDANGNTVGKWEVKE
jgi:hypothetical protein